MCGIAGTVNWGDSQTLASMVHVQEHRGPDDSGVWERRLPDGAGFGLGSRRLAILDLSAAGHMPMSNADGSLWITYNGEIYNFQQLRAELEAHGHIFRSRTDTEVLLRMYEREGRDCVRRLNGMFAFAIVDLRGAKPLLFLARDHFGIKPLYYVQRGQRFAFASEAKALLQLPGLSAEIDYEALHQYLTFLWVPDPRTMFRGIWKLPAGHYGVLQDGEFKIQQYWDLSFPASDTSYAADETELVAAVRQKFCDSVRAQMVSDVPVGAFLSAGLDSSSIVAAMARAAAVPVRTYTITFPAKYRVGEKLDDPAVAARTARQLGCVHQEIVVEPEVTSVLPKLTWHMDEPTADPAIVAAYLVCREARKTVTVLLSGVGGDELFAGYRKHIAQRWAVAYRSSPKAVRWVLERTLESMPALRNTPVKGLLRLARKMARSAALPPQDSFLMNSTYLDDAQKSQLYTPALREAAAGLDPWSTHRRYFDTVAHADFLHQMLYLDTKAFMVSLNLTYNDKMSMASSVETRVPFLDRELAEFVAASVPPAMKLRGFWFPTTKYILRKAMQGMVPDEVLSQPKAPFGAPVDYWLANDLREMTDDLLSETQVTKRGFFHSEYVRKLIAEQRSGARDWSAQIWQLLTFELWLKTFVDAQDGPAHADAERAVSTMA